MYVTMVMQSCLLHMLVSEAKIKMRISRLFSLYSFVIAYLHVAHGKSHLVFLMYVWVNDGDLGTGTVSVS